jgi:hypothetical protein
MYGHGRQILDVRPAIGDLRVCFATVGLFCDGLARPGEAAQPRALFAARRGSRLGADGMPVATTKQDLLDWSGP